MLLGWLLRALLGSLAYFASARLGYALSVHGIAALWPPSGVMLALLLLSERRWWPALATGGLLGSVASDLLSGFAPLAALAAATANLTESLVAAGLLSWGNDPRTLLTTLRGLARFVGGAVILSNALTAPLGALMLRQSTETAFVRAWFVWWVGDGLGMLLVAPVLLAWARPGGRLRQIRLRPLLEAAGLLALLATSAYLALGQHRGWLVQPGRYFVFPFLFWIALRFGALGAATGSLLVALVAIGYAALGLGPFRSPADLGLDVAFELHTYLLVASLTALVPAAVLEERQAAQRRLADSERRYRDCFESSPDPSWVYDIETRRILEVNQAAVTHYGYPRDEFLRLTIFDLRTPDEVPRLKANLAQVGDREVRGELWQHRRKDGRLIDVEVSAHSLTFAGRPARLVHAQDVTASRQADQALRATQDRLRRVIASSGAVIFELRRQGDDMVLDWISGNLTRVLGYTDGDCRQPGWWLDRVHPADRARLGGRPALAAYRDGTAEYRLKHQDGRFRWLREELRVTRDAAGRPLAVAGAWLDITDSRQRDQQVQQSQKMEALGQLAGGVAHDFNNILTVMLAEAEEVLAHEDGLDPADRQSLEEIRRSAQRAAGLTRQLLTFSRREIVAPTRLDLNTVVGGLEGMLGRLLGEHIRIVLRLAPDLEPAFADQGQVEQVFVNLAVNARDAMPAGGVLTIETASVHLDEAYVAAHAGVVPGDYVMLAVSDVGGGMSEEVKQHLFEPFFTTKPMGRGTGLGLATCYAIARQAGGHIGVYSEPGLGTTIRVYLPVAREGLAPRVAPPPPAARAGGGERILLVEDEAAVRRVIARLLRAGGYAVREVASAEEAIAVLERDDESFDLLFTDVVLPRVGGSALAERAVELRPGIRTLFASGYSDDMVLQHRLLATGTPLLQKPFTTEDLWRKVREALGH
jgi:PAS domain S-box-containing protein